MGLDLVMAETGDQRDAPRFTRRIELIEQTQQQFRRQRRPALHADRIAHAAQEFNMRRIVKRVRSPIHNIWAEQSYHSPVSES
jgi:hypothetical protein